MNFKNWLISKRTTFRYADKISNFVCLESKEWYLFGESVVLYHGTTSALSETIRSEGLKPPDEKLENYILKLITQYLKNPPENLIDEIKSKLSFRLNSETNRTSDVVYLDGSFKEASNYANHYYKYGGEIAFDVWQTVNRHICRKKHHKKNCEEIHFPPIYNKSFPIVVEVEIPWKWMETYRDLRNTYESAILSWRTHSKYAYKDFSEYLKKAVESVEVRVRHLILPNMIKTIHSLSKPSTTGPES